MTKTIRAHFDGKVIVPDEPVDLPVDQPLDVELRLSETSAHSPATPEVIEERLRKLKLISGRIEGPTIPAEALRRENLYEERW
jgi:hypothetical protein